MFDVGQYWNPRQADLRQALKNSKLEKAKSLLYELHSQVHSSKVYTNISPTFMDEIWQGLSEKAFRTMPSPKHVTLAWNIWHITRIEDITINILIAGCNQVLNEEWLKRLNTKVKDTGNAMSKDEIVTFSNELNMEELRNYRDMVGLKSKEIIENLTEEDLKRIFKDTQLNRILIEGGLISHPESIWLMDFWGRKNVSGILLMPVTRHQIVHLNDCSKLKAKCNKL
ncbi:MAG TPA: DinB family protein [Clostridia bacterium]